MTGDAGGGSGEAGGSGDGPVAGGGSGEAGESGDGPVAGDATGEAGESGDGPVAGGGSGEAGESGDGPVAGGGSGEAGGNGDATDAGGSDAPDAGGPSGADEVSVERASPPPDWLIRVVNPVLKLLLRSPLHGLVSDRLLPVTVTGRRSGDEYTFPVGYERADGTVVVTSHGTNWWRNLRDGGAGVAVVLAGERRTGHAEVVEDDAAVTEVVHDRLERHGTGVARRMGLRVVGDAVPGVDTLAENVGHVVVVRIELD